MENKNMLIDGLKLYNIDFNDDIINRFDSYINTLVEWNKKINLTSIVEESEIIKKHFLDSISCVESGLDFENKKVIDVGTGAGFPGVPLKIVFPKMDITLLDSLKKRTLFLEELMNNLKLKSNIIHGRAEDYGNKDLYREKFDIIVSRAVASIDILSEYTLPFIKKGGYAIYMKGPSIFDEIEKGKKALEVLGGSVEKIISTKSYNNEYSHYIAVVKKDNICPKKYPRKAGIVEKNPIK